MQKPPESLSKEAKKLWAKISASYEFDEIGLAILANAMQAFDRMIEARSTLDREGCVYRDRFKQPRQHPAFLNEASSRLAMLRHLRALGVSLGDLPAGKEDEGDEQ
jgi:P27 family predicted phage terminase small subunit